MQGVSKDKFCKGTDVPKHAGNFSPCREIYKHYKRATYPIRVENGCMIIGNHTPVEAVLDAHLICLIQDDPYFNRYEQKGTHTFNGTKYPASKSVYRSLIDPKLLIYEESISTNGDFTWEFPDY